ncbi:putative multidrug resistance pump [Microthyrium microscopicum]|uniref:Putative multidrug resistance pump n=1 Tax=Microthyrium microscopicum TaxID=703497 RepID=A0A6A6UL92_9PEZI|nr:putative multidrug resistance pump [Microthyrium microscopicum]
MIIGRLGPLQLSIAASGYMIATCTGWLLAVGGTTALDALGSRSFTNKPDNLGHIGILLQRCLLVITVLYLPVALLWCFVGPILTLCGQSTELAYGTQTFMRHLVPFGPGYLYFETLKKFLQCQNIQTPGTAILFVVAVIHVPLCWFIVHTLDFGLLGGVVATGSMYWLACFLIFAYICFVDGSQAWMKPSREALRDIGSFARLVGWGLVMVGAEWWAFELIAIAAGAMGSLPMAAQSIMMTVDSIFALIPFGLGVASTNRVANLMGHNRIEQARLAARAASCLAIANGCLTMTVIMLLRRPISRVFSDNSEVVALAAAVFPWGAAFQVVDSLQAANSGCLRALGRADIGATVNIVAYYVFAIPVGIITGFYLELGLHGLWLGVSTCTRHRFYSAKSATHDSILNFDSLLLHWLSLE